MPVLLKGITLPSSLSYPKISEFELFEIMTSCPVQTGLVGSYFLGSINADPAHNFANPTLPLLKKGTPVNQKTYAIMSKSGYYDTQIKSSATQTLVCMARFPSLSSGALPVLSNYFKDSSGVATGDSLMFTPSTVRTYAQTASGISYVAKGLVTPVSGEMRIMAGLISSSPGVGAFLLEDQVVTSSATGMGTRGLSTRNLLVGTTHSTDEFLLSAEVSAVLIFNADIGTTNLELVMKWLRNSVGVQAGIWSS